MEIKRRVRRCCLVLLVAVLFLLPIGQIKAAETYENAFDLVTKKGWFDIVMKIDGKSTTYRVYATASSKDATTSHSVTWSMELRSGEDLGYTIKSRTNSLSDGASGYYVFEAVFEGGVPGYKLTWDEKNTTFFDNGLYSEIEESSDFSIRIDTNDLGCTNFETGQTHYATLAYDFTPKSYKQTLQVRYENADGTWGDYKNVINGKSYKTGETVSWNTDGKAYDTTIYQKKSVSFVCPGRNYTKKVDIDRNKFPVTVTAGTGIQSVSGDGTYRYGEKPTISATVKTGYHWGSWSGYSNSSKQDYSFTVKQARDYTANAVINQSTLTVNPNGGTWNNSTQPQSFTQNYNTTKSIPNPTIGNYTATFDAMGGTVIGTNNAVQTVTTNKAFASWTQAGNAGSLVGTTFTFGSVNGGVGTLTATYTGSYNVTVPAGASLAGYDFQGWFTARTGGTKLGQTVTLSANTTYYAQWKPVTLTVRYDANGGVGTMTPDTTSYGAAYQLRANGFSRQDYTFIGWSLTADGGTECYQPGDNIVELLKQPENVTAGGITLYALWKPNVSVVYTGGEGSDGETVVDAGTDGNGYLLDESVAVTIYDNVDAITGEDHFTKEEEVTAFLDDEGESVKQNVTGKVVGWKKALAADERMYLKGSTELLYPLCEGAAGKIELTAVWDMGPTIEAYDLYYSLDEAKSGAITEEELLSQARAGDEVIRTDDAGNIIKENIELNAGADDTAKTEFKVLDYAPEDFTQFEQEFSVSETYCATDSVGNVTMYRITVHIVDSEPRDTNQDKRTVRFVSKEYYPSTFASDSVWVTDADYAAAITGCLANERVGQELSDSVFLFPDSSRVIKPGSGNWETEPEQTWKFSHEDVIRVQEFVNTHGIGYSKEPDALDKFLDEFKSNRVK